MRDVFEPSFEPAKSLYVAFQQEAKHRKGRDVKDWILAERRAVHAEAVRQAAILGLRAPTIEEVERAEIYASGSVDYGAKWAYRLTDFMKQQ